MLVLSRRVGEKVVIGHDITVSVVEVVGNRVKLAFQAPDEVRILRAELASARQAKPAADASQDPDLVGKPDWSAGPDADLVATGR